MHLPQHYLDHLRVFLALIIPSPGEEGSKSFLLVTVAYSNSAVLKNETAVNKKLLNKDALVGKKNLYQQNLTRRGQIIIGRG